MLGVYLTNAKEQSQTKPDDVNLKKAIKICKEFIAKHQHLGWAGLVDLVRFCRVRKHNKKGYKKMEIWIPEVLATARTPSMVFETKEDMADHALQVNPAYEIYVVIVPPLNAGERTTELKGVAPPGELEREIQ